MSDQKDSAAYAIRQLADGNTKLKRLAKELETDDPKLQTVEDVIGCLVVALHELHKVHRKL